VVVRSAVPRAVLVALSSLQLVLGLTWTLILRYEMSQFGENEARLLAWVKELCDAFEVPFEGGWSRGFSDGKVRRGRAYMYTDAATHSPRTRAHASVVSQTDASAAPRRMRLWWRRPSL
jgi:hypothetical protein